MDVKTRFGNAGFWISLVSFFYLLLSSFDAIQVSGDLGLLTDIVAHVLVFMGIVNNPTTASRFYGD